MSRIMEHVERDDAKWPADGDVVTVRGHSGVAWAVLGWETEPDADTEWSGSEERTGRVACIMVGDDRKWFFDESELSPLAELDYCHVCGQVGCTHDGLDRSEVI